MTTRGALRVLVVEDDPDYAFIVATLLRREGYTAVIAQDGLSALQRIDNEQPDLVMLDLQLPLLDGSDVLRELRAQYPETPVIVVSGALDAKPRARALGATAVLTKPLDFDEFFDTIAAVFSARPGVG